MSSARAEILGRIRGALADRPAAREVPWVYGRAVGTGDLDVVRRFVERVADYRARVDRVGEDAAAAAITAALQAVSAERVVADAAVRTCWPDSARWIADDMLTSTVSTRWSPPRRSRSPTPARSSSTTGPDRAGAR